MTDFIKLAGKHIDSLGLYRAGKPIDELKREFGLDHIVKLASNENPLGPSLHAKEAMIEAIKEVERYPLMDAFHLRQALSKELNISPDNLVFGAGSNELLDIFMHTFLKTGEHVIAASPSFSVYESIPISMGCSCNWVPMKEGFVTDLDKMKSEINDKSKIIFIANPNNPTGAYINSDDLRSFISQVPKNVLIVMDEAYVEFADAEDMPDTLGWLSEFDNLVLMRTFSKAYGLAGARIGYMIAHKKCCELVNKVRQPFNTSAISQAGAVAALKDKEWLNKVIENNTDCKYLIYEALEKMNIKYIPTQANFMLVEVGDGQKVFNELLKHGVIVRYMGPSLQKYIRLSIGLPEENNLFINSLSKVL